VRYDFLSVKIHEKMQNNALSKKSKFRFLIFDFEDALLEVLDYESIQRYLLFFKFLILF